MVERQNAQGGEQRVVDADTVLCPDVDEHRAPVRHVVHGPEVEVVVVDKHFDRRRQLHLEHDHRQHDAEPHVEQATAPSPRRPPVKDEHGGEGDPRQHEHDEGTPTSTSDRKGRAEIASNKPGDTRNNPIMITIALTPTTTGASAGRASSRPKIAGRRAASSVTP